MPIFTIDYVNTNLVSSNGSSLQTPVTVNVPQSPNQSIYGEPLSDNPRVTGMLFVVLFTLSFTTAPSSVQLVATGPGGVVVTGSIGSVNFGSSGAAYLIADVLPVNGSWTLALTTTGGTGVSTVIQQNGGGDLITWNNPQTNTIITVSTVSASQASVFSAGFGGLTQFPQLGTLIIGPAGQLQAVWKSLSANFIGVGRIQTGHSGFYLTGGSAPVSSLADIQTIQGQANPLVVPYIQTTTILPGVTGVEIPEFTIINFAATSGATIAVLTNVRYTTQIDYPSLPSVGKPLIPAISPASDFKRNA